MERLRCVFVATLVFLAILFHGGTVTALRSDDGLEEWGYVEVRPKAHMFWWLYRSPYRVDDSSKPWPTILWLQGGPGSSGAGYGNFKEIGPLDYSLQPRNFTWLRKADLLFVDNPVGSGYSYVEDTKLLVKTDTESTSDLMILLTTLFNNNTSLQKSPVFFVGESYGGRFAVSLGLSAIKAIREGTLKLTLGGVVLGDSWISPEDYVFSWGPLLKDVSRLDDIGLQISNSLAMTIKQQIEAGDFVNATNYWSQLEYVLRLYSHHVDFYNFMLDDGSDPIVLSAKNLKLFKEISTRRYSKYLTTNPRVEEELMWNLLNGVIKKKLKIIPTNIRWSDQGNAVFTNFEGEFMKSRIAEVDDLLSLGVNVTVYNGQLDVICATKGTDAWLKKLKWPELSTFLNQSRAPIFCGNNQTITKGFFKSHKNLSFYWILGAGHFVPVDQPCAALNMVGAITQSPAV